MVCKNNAFITLMKGLNAENLYEMTSCSIAVTGETFMGVLNNDKRITIVFQVEVSLGYMVIVVSKVVLKVMIIDDY